ncbi:hypothetical protein BBP40_012194 [Aspergillus hancockii]|nr:hypothetical protein BBP40_012194 [Aspergillus hancockii]
MMAEVYSGQSRQWKHHLQGAWAFLLDSESEEPWNESQFGCFSTQSLLIVRIISGTTLTGSNSPTLILTPELQSSSAQMITSSDSTEANIIPSTPNTELAFASSILSTPQFGFTIGAHRSLLECISTITSISQQMRSTESDTTPFGVDCIVARILSRLEIYRTQIKEHTLYNDTHPTSTEIVRSSDQAHEQLARYQLNAFIHATYIYLYRALLDVPPKRVSTYVSLTFQNITAFNDKNSGNLSLWPAFIAAVEAYTEQDMDSARSWLEQSAQFGLGNRLSVRRIIEEVWRRREDAHMKSAMDRGLVTVDWRDVVNDLEIDVLLV